MRIFKLGEVLDFADDELNPCKAWLFDRRGQTHYRSGDTFYGFTTAPTTISTLYGRFHLPARSSFCVPEQLTIEGNGYLVQRINHHSMLRITGPMERFGRLCYIDGCSDTLLISPLRVGDPCLNHLHFPCNIRQTMHTHPSVRIGIVVAGQGRVVTPQGETDLRPGYGWALEVDDPHCFHTDDSVMDVIAWHPDSDTGPSDDDHPMLNRTMVEGVSAREIDEIRTATPVF